MSVNWKFWASIFAAIFGALFCILLYNVSPSEGGVFPPCPTNYISNFYCPGCGTLRALHALLHGDPVEAVSQNFLTVLFLAILPAIYFFPKIFSSVWAPACILFALIIFTILRNLPYFAFLAPH